MILEEQYLLARVASVPAERAKISRLLVARRLEQELKIDEERDVRAARFE